jgi:hypothetical protein
MPFAAAEPLSQGIRPPRPQSAPCPAQTHAAAPHCHGRILLKVKKRVLSDRYPGNTPPIPRRPASAPAQAESVVQHSRSAEEHSESVVQHSRSAEEHSESVVPHSRSAEEHSESVVPHSRSAEEHSRPVKARSASVQASSASAKASSAPSRKPMETVRANAAPRQSQDWKNRHATSALAGIPPAASTARPQGLTSGDFFASLKSFIKNLFLS